ncbi:hypothetical protein [Thiovibrio frasassiensis]|uniref:Aminoglycoside phosphotransferase domain-containing protein n=1 Tax=Thiovibrio frasassiensis TaxID=2984131 RepID=A0A9X4MIW4_9BACT|nr:hypothetical protein [Thiovibrio frasassiensis]MDG4475684.1 hypothetical protein [Thiovibrio frasassiensis]
MADASLPPFIQALLKPEAYPHPAPEISLVQTHISYVLLAGSFVYKIKKPVDFGFLNFTTLEKRKHFCEQELLLNRRLCPSLYLGLVPITLQDAAFSLDGPGTPVEYAVKMARMPEERMMAKVIDRGELSKETLDRIIAILVPFYAKAESTPAIAAFGTAQAVSVNVLENFDQTQGFIGCPALSREQFEAISGYARAFLSTEELFAERIKAGRVRDCHGDLYSANICLANGIYIYDCIEFNERFRYCDVASDVAFLAMDLDFHDLSDLSDYFIEQFCQAAEDHTLLPMLNFYKCYRAFVRGKIGLFTAHAPEVDPATAENCLALAKKYFTLAQRYAAS